MRLLRSIHAWSGAILGLALALVCLSGALLTLRPLYNALVYPEAAEIAPPPTPEALGLEAEAVMVRYGDEIIAALEAPVDGFGYWRIYYDAGGGAFVASGSLALVDRWGSSGTLPDALYEFHAHLFAGETGEKIVGLLGLVLVLFVVSGVAIWLGGRRRLRPALAPRSAHRRDLLAWHTETGVLLAVFIALSGITGAAMVYGDTAEAVFALALSDEAAAAPPSPEAVAPGWDSAFAAARERFPGATIRQVFLSLDPGDPIGIRLRQPAEWHPNGRTLVWIAPASGAVSALSDARAASPAVKAADLMFPLHAGIAGATWWSVVIGLAGLFAAALALVGVAAFLMRRRRRRAA